MRRGPANESVQVAVVGRIWGFGDRTDGTVIDYIQFIVVTFVGANIKPKIPFVYSLPSA